MPNPEISWGIKKSKKGNVHSTLMDNALGNYLTGMKLMHGYYKGMCFTCE